MSQYSALQLDSTCYAHVSRLVLSERGRSASTAVVYGLGRAPMHWNDPLIPSGLAGPGHWAKCTAGQDTS